MRVERKRRENAGTSVWMALGRFLTGACGVLLMKVVFYGVWMSVI